MSFANDAQIWIRWAKEAAYGTPPAYSLTLGTGATGTFSLTFGGQTYATIANTATAATIQTGLRALSTLTGSLVTVTGPDLPVGPLVITFPGDYAGGAFSADFTGITGGTPALTGGPQWLTLKARKATHDAKIAVDFAEEMRNSPDPYYSDGVIKGGQITDLTVDTYLRSDQMPHYLMVMGCADTQTTPGASAYDHALKFTNPASYASYTVQIYDGKSVWQIRGFVGTGLKVNGKIDTKGEYAAALKGWGFMEYRVPYDITPVMPSNSIYVRLSPSTSGVQVMMGAAGSQSASSLVESWSADISRDAKPKFTQTGTNYPYRPSYGKRMTKLEVDLVFDDTTEVDAAALAAATARAFTITMPGTEVLGSFVDRQILDIPSLKWESYKIEASNDGAPMAKLTGRALYSNALGGQFQFTVRNGTSTAY